ncbi:MAG: N-acetyl sugar amidotransferase [Fibrobacteria bacterium]
MIAGNAKKTGRPYRVCAQCVMDSSDAKIVFDARGICDHCRVFRESIQPDWNGGKGRERMLEALRDRIVLEGRGKDFNCIIGMSGGVDSTYLTYFAKEKLGLRPLVFHVDAGWNSQIAVNNIERIVDKLGLDLYTEVIDWEEMKDLQLAFFKSGVPHIDTPQDHAFFATMYHFAAKHKVRYILTGGNYSTECVRNPLEWMYYQSDSAQLRDIHQRFGSRPLKTFPVTNILWHKVYLPYLRRVRLIRPLDYLVYNKEEATAFLERDFQYQRYAQKHFESRFTQFYEGYWLPKKFGFDTRKVQFSSLILTGQMTRDEALAKLAKPAYDEDSISHDFEYIATKLGISVAELQGYMDAPNKTYRDYRNQQWIYETGAWVMRKLSMERGGKR